MGQKVSICGAPQIRRHRGGLGMDDFLLLFSVYTDYNISRRKINTDFSKVAVMLIRISNINMEIDIFGAEDIQISKLCVGCMSFGKALTRIPRMAAGNAAPSQSAAFLFPVFRWG
ncbi:hypothetical protein [Clostridium fessum]|uniref:hypothetical protein n=1 Tax=Clostridium fessum TaxID=2126740 RepID=UPI001D0DE04C|nr:hypothetical protein [Clostridium fessum]